MLCWYVCHRQRGAQEALGYDIPMSGLGRSVSNLAIIELANCACRVRQVLIRRLPACFLPLTANKAEVTASTYTTMGAFSMVVLDFLFRVTGSHYLTVNLNSLWTIAKSSVKSSPSSTLHSDVPSGNQIQGVCIITYKLAMSASFVTAISTVSSML